MKLVIQKVDYAVDNLINFNNCQEYFKINISMNSFITWDWVILRQFLSVYIF